MTGSLKAAFLFTSSLILSVLPISLEDGWVVTWCCVILVLGRHNVGQGLTVFTVGAGGDCLDIFSRLSFLLSLEDGLI